MTTASGSCATRPASAVLGPDNPLSRATAALEIALKQWRAVAAVLIGSMIALIEGRAWATALAGSALVVLLALTLIASAHHQHKRDIALELILEGRERLAIAAVQHQRRRLLCQSTRTMLARNLEDIIEQATCPRAPRMRLICPLFERRVVASVEDNIRPIIRLLVADNPPARGVAGCERLITHACSPLYGQDAEVLRQELARLLDLFSG